MYAPGTSHMEQILVGVIVVPDATLAVADADGVTSPISPIPVFNGLLYTFRHLHQRNQIKKSAHTKNSGDSPESSQVIINQFLCCILTISRFYIGLADVTVNLRGL